MPRREFTIATAPVNSGRGWANGTPSMEGGPELRPADDGIRAAPGQLSEWFGMSH
jgi:hypothetical protein